LSYPFNELKVQKHSIFFFIRDLL